jgi:hypothetical protein
MGTNTTNYRFFMPDPSDSMADVKKNITDNFKIIEPRNDVTVIAAGGALPQAGSYNIGDRVFRADAAVSPTWPSIYILVCKDANWGWHWRPVQQILSPWVSVPSTVINNSDYEIHPSRPFQIALDSRGWCYWRGNLRKITAGIPTGTQVNFLKTVPEGIRPNTTFKSTLAVTPYTGSSTGQAGNISGRLSMTETGTISGVFFNTNNGVSQNIWLDNVSYNNSAGFYYSG